MIMKKQKLKKAAALAAVVSTVFAVTACGKQYLILLQKQKNQILFTAHYRKSRKMEQLT